jgi:hypothetical protein
MERYLGIDTHRESCTVVVLSAGGKKTDERVVPTETAALVQYVRSLSGELHICVEEGEWSEWLVELRLKTASSTFSSVGSTRLEGGGPGDARGLSTL